MAAIEYYIKSPYNQQPKLITKRRDTGELINLSGKAVTEKLPATKAKPEREVTARGATQADLAYLLEEGPNNDPGRWHKIIGKREKATASSSSSSK